LDGLFARAGEHAERDPLAGLAVDAECLGG
jgi:hypothetical protein